MLRQSAVVIFTLIVCIFSACHDGNSNSEATTHYLVAIEDSSLSEPSLGLEEAASLLGEPQINTNADGSGDLRFSTRYADWVIELIDALIEHREIPVVEILQVESSPSGIFQEVSRTGFFDAHFTRTELRGENGESWGNFVIGFDSQQGLDQSGLFPINVNSLERTLSTAPGYRFYLKLYGLDDLPSADNHEIEIELQAVSLTHTPLTSSTEMRRIDFVLKFRANVGRWTPAFMEATSVGKLLDKGTIIYTRVLSGVDRQVLKIKMEDIIIVSAQINEATANSREQIVEAELRPNKITFEPPPQHPQ